MGFIAYMIIVVAILFGYGGMVSPLTNEDAKTGQESSVQDAVVSILRMVANADIIPAEIREVLITALTKDSVTKDFEAWKRVLLEKLNQLDNDH